MSKKHRLCFLPHDYHWRKTRGRNNVFCAGIFLTALLSAGSIWAWNDRSLDEIQAQQTNIRSQVSHTADQLKQMAQLQAQQQRIEQAAESTAARVAGVPRSFVLSEVCSAVPMGVTLADLSLVTSHDRATVQLTGTADTESQITQFIGSLSRSSVLRDVDTVSDDPADGPTPGSDKIRKFVLRLSVDSSANVPLGSASTTAASVELAVPQ